MLHVRRSLKVRGKLLIFDRPMVMGILNVTPDSFFDGGRYVSIEKTLARVAEMIEEGADLIDVGGMSTRPGAEDVGEAKELERVVPVITEIHHRWPDMPISIDTVRVRVAIAAVEAGAGIVNDISGGNLDKDMFAAVAELGVPYILMHMQGEPHNMQKDPVYEDVVLEVLDFFIAKVDLLREEGVVDIILDPGFGFGKTIDHNYELLANLHAFHILDLPVLAGLSRKSMIYKLLGKSPDEALAGTNALNMVALQQGASILRVHDVAAAMDVVRCREQLEKFNPLSSTAWPSSPKTT